jgi:hypothetical protein
MPVVILGGCMLACGAPAVAFYPDDIGDGPALDAAADGDDASDEQSDVENDADSDALSEATDTWGSDADAQTAACFGGVPPPGAQGCCGQTACYGAPCAVDGGACDRCLCNIGTVCCLKYAHQGTIMNACKMSSSMCP